MGLFDNLTYAFSGSAPAGDPGSPQALETRRKIALAMIGRDRKGYPKNIGEGLTAIGDALGERSQLAQLDAQQAAYDDWGIKHPPPRASSMMGQPPAAAPPAATGPSADASPQMPTIAPVATADASAAPPPEAAAPASWLSGAVANNDAYQPADALPPVQDAGGAPALASADTETMSDAPPMGVPTGQPNPQAVRASISQLMQARQGGPQPNPMLAGQSPASAPSTISPDPSLLGSPLEAEQNSPRTLPGVQVAQGAPIGTAPDIPEINRVTPPVTMPRPGPVQQPPNAPYNQMEKDGADMEQWGNQRGDERYIKQGQLLQRLGKEQRDRENADLQEKYRLDRQEETQRRLEQERAQQGKGVAQKQLEEATAKANAAIAAQQITDKTGLPANVVQDELSKRLSGAGADVSLLKNARVAKQALDLGVFSGLGAGAKTDFAKARALFGNLPASELVSRAEMLAASTQAMVKYGLNQYQPGDPRVTNGDLIVGKAIVGGTPAQQLQTQKELVNMVLQDANNRVGEYERYHDWAVGGLKPEEGYRLRVDPIHPDPAVAKAATEILLKPENINDPYAHQKFDQRFGPGSAALEVARAERRARRGK